MGNSIKAQVCCGLSDRKEANSFETGAGKLAPAQEQQQEMVPVVPRLLDTEWLRRTYAEEHGGAEAPDLKALVSYFVARDGPWGYGRLCADLLADSRTVEHNAATRHHLAQMSGAEKLLFMNFKSHNILEEARASKLFAILADVGADIVCLSEALVPNSVVDAGAGSLYELREGAESLIVQPHPGPNIAECFREKKRADYAALGGEKTTAFPWEARLHGLGYRFLMFSNPQSCPFGSNWGNVMVFRSRPDACRSIDLAGRAEGKKGFGGSYDESRSAIVADVGGHRICVTHLEDKNEGLRAEQWKSIAQQAFGDSGETKGDRTLVGDINALDPESYSEEQWRILREAHFPPLKEDQDLPTAACTGLSELFGARPSNRGQQFESLYQKCVSHGWSSRFTSASMLVTDATDFDHQPLVLTV